MPAHLVLALLQDDLGGAAKAKERLQELMEAGQLRAAARREGSVLGENVSRAPFELLATSTDLEWNEIVSLSLSENRLKMDLDESVGTIAFYNLRFHVDDVNSMVPRYGLTLTQRDAGGRLVRRGDWIELVARLAYEFRESHPITDRSDISEIVRTPDGTDEFEDSTLEEIISCVYLEFSRNGFC